MRRASVVRHGFLALLVGASAACGASGASLLATLPAGPTPPPGFPVGTYTKDVSAADYTAAGVDDPNVGNNVGRFTLALNADGTWTNVLDAGGAAQVNPVFRGTYVVNGSDLAYTTTFPTEYAGQVAHYTWRVDQAGLWTTVVSSADPLEILLGKAIDAKPWIRTR